MTDAEHSKAIRKAIRLATAALHAALTSKWGSAGRYIERIGHECGGNGIDAALIAWCDILTAHARDGDMTSTGPVRVGFVEMKSGSMSVPVPDRIRWAGRLIAARAEMDEQAWRAVLDELPTEGVRAGSYVSAVLECVALTINGFPRGFATMGRDS